MPQVKPFSSMNANVVILGMALLYAGYLVFELDLLDDAPQRSVEEERAELVRLIVVSSIMTGALVVFSIRRMLGQAREYQRRHLAETSDVLTGLCNRRGLENFAVDALMRLDPGREQIVVLFIDLDGFKPVNDAYGHAAGDAVLVELGHRLRKRARATDCVARFGGDEFAVLSVTAPGISSAMELARTMQELIRKPVVYEGRELVVDATIGVAIARPENGADMLLNVADHAMYDGKRSGGGRIVLAGGKPALAPNSASVA